MALIGAGYSASPRLKLISSSTYVGCSGARTLAIEMTSRSAPRLLDSLLGDRPNRLRQHLRRSPSQPSLDWYSSSSFRSPLPFSLRQPSRHQSLQFTRREHLVARLGPHAQRQPGPPREHDRASAAVGAAAGGAAAGGAVKHGEAHRPPPSSGAASGVSTAAVSIDVTRHLALALRHSNALERTPIQCHGSA